MLQFSFLSFSVLLLNSEMIEKSKIFLGLLQFFFLGFSVSVINFKIFLGLLQFSFLGFPFHCSIPPICSKSNRFNLLFFGNFPFNFKELFSTEILFCYILQRVFIRFVRLENRRFFRRSNIFIECLSV